MGFPPIDIELATRWGLTAKVVYGASRQFLTEGVHYTKGQPCHPKSYTEEGLVMLAERLGVPPAYKKNEGGAGEPVLLKVLRKCPNPLFVMCCHENRPVPIKVRHGKKIRPGRMLLCRLLQDRWECVDATHGVPLPPPASSQPL